jgi:hypothetical protein
MHIQRAMHTHTRARTQTHTRTDAHIHMHAGHRDRDKERERDIGRHRDTQNCHTPAPPLSDRMAWRAGAHSFSAASTSHSPFRCTSTAHYCTSQCTLRQRRCRSSQVTVQSTLHTPQTAVQDERPTCRQERCHTRAPRRRRSSHMAPSKPGPPYAVEVLYKPKTNRGCAPCTTPSAQSSEHRPVGCRC